MKYKYTKKSLLYIPYYDEICKDDKLKKKLFKRYHKEYSVKKIIDRKYYPDDDVTIKRHRVIIDLKENSFNMSNNVFGVLNLHSYQKSILKAVPSFEKLFAFNKKDIGKRKSKRRIVFNHILYIIDKQMDTVFPLSTAVKQHINIQDFFADYEKFMREYTLNRGYHFEVRSLEVVIQYSYYGTKKNKSKYNKKIKSM